ncbi:MAG: 1-acyl-sn-glycerol-3-phosphate acyltransferase [Bacteroidetes bacterium]|nr:1-acyl-sn-glycerol-3-phosphate acyltransferase [Bacteroidota bacterium]
MQEKNNSEPGVEITKNFIDLRGVIAKKSPTLLKVLPWFVLSYLRRIIHEDEINDFIYRNRNYWGLDFANAIMSEFVRKLTVIGEENIPIDGRYIIVSNHPLGGLDGIALISVAGRKRQDIVFPVNDILMNIPNLRPLFIPINKHGSNAQNVKILNDTFASDQVILYFPAGMVSRKRKGVIKDLSWKKTFITKAREYKRDVVPAYIEGKNSAFFYNLANYRKALGIKANLEMLYLVDETYKQRGKSITMTFGKPIPYETFDRKHSDTYWAEEVMKTVYNLPSTVQ